jgi:hypothetical protein
MGESQNSLRDAKVASQHLILEKHNIEAANLEIRTIRRLMSILACFDQAHL